MLSSLLDLFKIYVSTFLTVQSLNTYCHGRLCLFLCGETSTQEPVRGLYLLWEQLSSIFGGIGSILNKLDKVKEKYNAKINVFIAKLWKMGRNMIPDLSSR